MTSLETLDTPRRYIPTPDDIAAARRLVIKHARDAGEVAEFLGQLGIEDA